MLSWKQVIGFGIAALVCVSAPTSAQLLLDADFEDKVVDLAIGTGGPELGEPDSVSATISAVVRDTPTATKSLEISDLATSGTPFVRFGLIGDAEVATGSLAIAADLWFAMIDGYWFRLREASGSASSFLNLSFNDTGKVFLSDNDTSSTEVGVYSIGRSLPLLVVFDMDAGTYDVSLDGTVIAAAQTHGITEDGIGGILFAMNNDADQEGTWYIDNLRVIPGGMFSDGFEIGSTSNWSATVPELCDPTYKSADFFTVGSGTDVRPIGAGESDWVAFINDFPNHIISANNEDAVVDLRMEIWYPDAAFAGCPPADYSYDDVGTGQSLAETHSTQDEGVDPIPNGTVWIRITNLAPAAGSYSVFDSD